MARCNVQDASGRACWRALGHATLPSLAQFTAIMSSMRIKVFPQTKTDKWFACAEGDRSHKAWIGDTIEEAVGRAAYVKIYGSEIDDKFEVMVIE